MPLAEVPELPSLGFSAGSRVPWGFTSYTPLQSDPIRPLEGQLFMNILLRWSHEATGSEGKIQLSSGMVPAVPGTYLEASAQIAKKVKKMNPRLSQSC